MIFRRKILVGQTFDDSIISKCFQPLKRGTNHVRGITAEFLDEDRQQTKGVLTKCANKAPDGKAKNARQCDQVPFIASVPSQMPGMVALLALARFGQTFLLKAKQIVVDLVFDAQSRILPSDGPLSRAQPTEIKDISLQQRQIQRQRQQQSHITKQFT